MPQGFPLVGRLLWIAGLLGSARFGGFGGGLRRFRRLGRLRRGGRFRRRFCRRLRLRRCRFGCGGFGGWLRRWFCRGFRFRRCGFRRGGLRLGRLRIHLVSAHRVLVTGHDAFNYLGKRYGLKVHATDFVSSEAELSASELQELVNTIVSAKVPAIFVDNLKNPQAVKSLREAVKAKGWDVRISDKELYADSLGEKAPVDTYLGVFQNNVDAITTELGAK